MASDSRRPPWALIVFALFFAAILGTCVAVCDDEDDDGAWTPATTLESREDRSDGRDSDGKCQGANYCQDDDLSPSFEDSPVIVCLPGSTCHFTEAGVHV